MNGNAGSIVEEIQEEIMNNGSVSAVLTVYNVGVQILQNKTLTTNFMQDFMYYSSGIYEPTDTSDSNKVGLHSVRLIGWGEALDSNNTVEKYWLAANSWDRVSL